MQRRMGLPLSFPGRWECVSQRRENIMCPSMIVPIAPFLRWEGCEALSPSFFTIIPFKKATVCCSRFQCFRFFPTVERFRLLQVPGKATLILRLVFLHSTCRHPRNSFHVWYMRTKHMAPASKSCRARRRFRKDTLGGKFSWCTDAPFQAHYASGAPTFSRTSFFWCDELSVS